VARARRGVVLLAVWLAVFGVVLPSPLPARGAQSQSGRVLAVVGRQVAFLNFEAPRPRVLTALPSPSFAVDVAAVAASPVAALAVAEPFGPHGELGGDLLGLNLASEDGPFPFVLRASPGEWLGGPAWLPDGSALLFQREDVGAGSDLYAGQATVRYPARIEIVPPTGSTRAVLINYGHNPSPSPDGAEVAFVRLSPSGSMLLAHDMTSGSERTLVPPGVLPDIAYPRYSPAGERIAFVATSASTRSDSALAWLMPQVAFAHGMPWNLWIVQRDGSGLRQLAAVGADDASLSWSPDGAQLFVYGSTGARLVDATTGETDLLPYLAGFGAIAWLP
jgi:WD40-like Beta Propeller Repeat